MFGIFGKVIGDPFEWWSPWLFMNEGRSVGSHAVGLSSKVFAELLELTLRRDAVFDDDVASSESLVCRVSRLGNTGIIGR